jgi:ankyrin repeat protein
MSTKEYKVMKEGRDFFTEAINIISSRSLDEFKSLIQKFKDNQETIETYEILQEFQSEGRTLLHISASYGKSDFVRYILTECKDRQVVNQPDKNGMTPLMHATVAESDETMKILIEFGANVNLKNKDSASCAHFAASDGSVPRLQLLVDAGADLSVCSGAGTPLHWAAGKGRTSVVKYLIEKKVDLNIPNKDTLPAVVMAGAAGNEEIVCDLIDAGATINHILSGNLTLLHLCAENGLLRAINLITALPIGIELNSLKTTDGNYPIHLAAMSKHRDIIEALLPFCQSLVNNMTVDEILADGEVRMIAWQKNHVNHASDTSQQPTTSTRNLESIEAPTDPQNIKSAEAHKLKGNEKYLKKDYAGAIEEYSAAIKLLGNSAPLWSNRSACYMAINDYNNALLDAEVCRRLDPNWPKGCYRLAAARLALGFYEDAAVAAFEGCKLDESNVELKKLLQDAVRLGQEEHKAKQNKS